MQKKLINNPLKLLIFFALISFSGIAQVTRTIELEAVDIVSDIIPTLTIGEKTIIMKKIELNNEKFDDLYLQRQWKRMGLTKAGVNINATTWANHCRSNNCCPILYSCHPTYIHWASNINFVPISSNI